MFPLGNSIYSLHNPSSNEPLSGPPVSTDGYHCSPCGRAVLGARSQESGVGYTPSPPSIYTLGVRRQRLWEQVNKAGVDVRMSLALSSQSEGGTLKIVGGWVEIMRDFFQNWEVPIVNASAVDDIACLQQVIAADQPWRDEQESAAMAEPPQAQPMISPE